jgi:hypothetical protein
MRKGRGNWTREPLHRPFVAWNQVDAITVAISVPIYRNSRFLRFKSVQRREQIFPA